MRTVLYFFLLCVSFSVSAVQAVNFLTISSLSDLSGKPLLQLNAGEATQAYFTVRNNAQSHALTLKTIKVIGIPGIYVRKAKANVCFGKTLPPGQQVRCDVTVMAGASLPDTTSHQVQTVIRLADGINQGASAPMTLSVVADHSESLELDIKAPFDEIYQQKSRDALVSGSADFILKNTSNIPFTITSIVFDKRQEFSLAGSGCEGVSLKPGHGADSQCMFSANFASKVPGEYLDNLVVAAKHNDHPFKLTLPQRVKVNLPAEQALQLDAIHPFKQQIMRFGVPISAKAVYQITNHGTPLTVTSVDLASHDARFAVGNPYQCNGLLSQGKSCQLTMLFSTLPEDQPRAYSNHLVVHIADASTHADVSVVLATQIFVPVLGAASWQMDAEHINAKLAIPADQPEASETLSATLSNTGLADIRIAQDKGIRFILGQPHYAVIDDDCDGVLPVGRSCTVHYRVKAVDADVAQSPLLGRLEVSGMAHGQALKPIVQTISTAVVKNVAPIVAFRWVDKQPLPESVVLDSTGHAVALGEYQLINQGNQAVTIIGVHLPKPRFSLYRTTSTCINAMLQPQEHCSASILFVTQGALMSTQYSDELFVDYRLNGQLGTEPVALFHILALQEHPNFNISSGPINHGLPQIFAYRKAGNYVDGAYKVTNTGTIAIDNVSYSIAPKSMVAETQSSGETPPCHDTHTLQAGKSCLIALRFTPNCKDELSCLVPIVLGLHGDSRVGHVDQTHSFRVRAIDARASRGHLTIEAVNPFKKTVPSHFGSAEAVYRITNHWLLSKATLGKLAVTNANFTLIDSNHCSGKTLAYHASCLITVRFSTNREGRYLNQLIVPVQWLKYYIAGSALMKINVLQ